MSIFKAENILVWCSAQRTL